MSQCKCGEHVFEELQLRLDCRTYQTSGRRRHGSGLVNNIALTIQKDKFTSTHVRSSAHILANIYHVLGSCVKKSIIFSDCSIWYFVVICLYFGQAKELLGEQFKRRLLMDGQYGNVSFICTQVSINLGFVP